MAGGKKLQLERVDTRYLELPWIGRCAGNFAILAAACPGIGSCETNHIECIVSINAELKVLISHGPEPFEKRQIDVFVPWIAFCAVMGISKLAIRRYAVGARRTQTVDDGSSLRTRCRRRICAEPVQ